MTASAAKVAKSNIGGRRDQREVSPEWFTGRTWMKHVSKGLGSADQDIYHVHFERGSRTKLHRHNGNQILMATRGRGSLEIFERFGTAREGFRIKRTDRIALAEGDVVHIPAKVLHTHGSTDKRREFAHIAINILPKRGGSQYRTVWYESDFESRASGIIR